MLYGNKSFVFTTQPNLELWTEKLPILSLNSQFCQLNGIPNDAQVEVQVLSDKLSELQTVIVDPLDEQDYEILVSI